MASSAALAIEDSVNVSQTPSQHEEVMLIGEIAIAVGLEPKTIRFYERVELVKPEKHGRIRIFRSKDIARLSGIKKLRQYGFSIAAIRKILKSEGELSLESIASPNVQRLLAAHLEHMRLKSEFIQEQMADLKAKLDLFESNQ